MWLGFIGFSNVETDTIILRKYTKAENFPAPLDSVIITSNNTQYSFAGDTLRFVAYTSDIVLGSEYDYEIYLPKIAKTYKLTKITEVQTSEKWSTLKGACMNPLINYEEDGQFVDARSNANRIFIKK